MITWTAWTDDEGICFLRGEYSYGATTLVLRGEYAFTTKNFEQTWKRTPAQHLVLMASIIEMQIRDKAKELW